MDFKELDKLLIALDDRYTQKKSNAIREELEGIYFNSKSDLLKKTLQYLSNLLHKQETERKAP